MNPESSGRPLLCDIAIVGGGPAGLSAGLILGRCLRPVFIVDNGQPRNRRARFLHGFPTRDPINPVRFLRLLRADLMRYPTVRQLNGTVVRIIRVGKFFVTRLNDGLAIQSRRVLLATGVTDIVPNVPGFEAIYGRSGFHCPYCDAWEWRGKRVVVYGQGKRAVGLASKLLSWTRHITVITDGPARMTAPDRRLLERHQIAIISAPVARFEHQRGLIRRVEYANGRIPTACDVLFFTLGQRQSCSIAEELGCQLTKKGAVKTFRHEITNVPGLYVAGDASTNYQFATIAVAEGVEAAVAIHESLLHEDLRHQP